MDRNFERALLLVLKHEGGFVNHPKDPGGATNLGVTIGTAKRLGIDVDGDGDTDILDIKKLKPSDAAKVYRAEYWNKIKGDHLPSGVDYAVFDFAVNSGPGRAAEYLQAIAGVAQDGAIGPQTVAAVTKLDPEAEGLSEKGGVFVIWHGGLRPQWVYADSSPDLAKALHDMADMDEVMRFEANGGLFVSWAFIKEEFQGGVVKYLNESMAPLAENPAAAALEDTPIAVIFPGKGVKK